MSSRKRCGDCREEKARSEFYSDGHKGGRCKECQKAHQRRKYHADPDSHRHMHRRWKYGMSAEQYVGMLAEQGGRCAICGTTDPGRASFFVDHDHACCPGVKSCGACVRGLLCGPCNNVLGAARDNPAVLASAADYLSRRIFGVEP